MNPFLFEATQFCLKGTILSISPIGNGHIHETYQIQTTEELYVFQRTNSSLFPDLAPLMENIALVTNFLRKEIQNQGGDPDREVLRIIPTKAGKTFLKTEKGSFRVYLSIRDAISFERAESVGDFTKAAQAFGKFTRLLDGFDAAKLHEILPGFHNTALRFANLKAAIATNRAGRLSQVEEEVRFALNRENITRKVIDLISQGLIPLRVTHNDTKLNNVMFDIQTREALAVIDLDTIMPGSLVYDFGDAIRYGCNSASEDEPDLTKVYFRTDLFKAFAKGYLSELRERITPMEKGHLVFGSILITYECGIRFLTDYLNGDTYFKIDYPKQNLNRCRTQFKLVEEMENRQKDLEDLIENLE